MLYLYHRHTPLDKYMILFIGAYVLIITIIELFTGKIIGRRWNISYTREKNPFAYWFYIIFQLILSSIMLILSISEFLK